MRLSVYGTSELLLFLDAYLAALVSGVLRNCCLYGSKEFLTVFLATFVVILFLAIQGAIRRQLMEKYQKIWNWCNMVQFIVLVPYCTSSSCNVEKIEKIYTLVQLPL